MSIIAEVAALAEDMTAWRRHLHANPEIGFECHRTAAFIAACLHEFGVDEVHERIAQSGIVGVIRGRGEGRTIALRAEVDAVGMTEATGLPHASTVPGRMHGGGHDGHVAMLLGAAHYLAASRNFAGNAVLIFQPAGEVGQGAKVMCAEGVLDRFGVDEVYSLHTTAAADAGRFLVRSGAFMAGQTDFEIHITGKGGHASRPHLTRDPVNAALAMGQAIQGIVSRNADCREQLVLSLTTIRAGGVLNVIPSNAILGGTIRAYSAGSVAMVRRRLQEICEGMGIAMEVDTLLGFPTELEPVVNDPRCAAFAAEVACEVVGPEAIDDNAQRVMGAQDFGAMLAERPGAFVFIGQGMGPLVLDSTFDFNDAILPAAASFLARLVERALPVD